MGEKLQLAARIVVAIENPQDIIVRSKSPFGQRAILKFSHFIGAKVLSGRHTPGKFTNQIQKNFEEPCLLIVTDPKKDHQPIKETTYVNIPVLAFCNTNSLLKNVDIAIPANNQGKHSIGVLYYLLARMVLQMRGVLEANQPLVVAVDCFFFRNPKKLNSKKKELLKVLRQLLLLMSTYKLHYNE